MKVPSANMKPILFAVLTIFSVLAYVSASRLPISYDDLSYDLNGVDESILDETDPDQPSIRQRRLTCDILSLEVSGVSIGHAACALKCLAQHKKGGYCHKGICICKKSSQSKHSKHSKHSKYFLWPT